MHILIAILRIMQYDRVLRVHTFPCVISVQLCFVFEYRTYEYPTEIRW